MVVEDAEERRPALLRIANLLASRKVEFDLPLAFVSKGKDIADIVVQRDLIDTLDLPNLDVFHFFQKVGASVLDMTQKAQNPWLSVSFTGDFYFNKQ